MQGASVQAEDRCIILNFESLTDAMQLLAPWKGAGPRLQAAAQVHGALRAVGVGMEVRVKGRTVAELGHEHMTGSLLTLIQPAV